jgi:hypothetical protein
MTTVKSTVWVDRANQAFHMVADVHQTAIDPVFFYIRGVAPVRQVSTFQVLALHVDTRSGVQP